MANESNIERYNRPRLIEWGGIPFYAYRVSPELAKQMLPRLNTGNEVSREGRDGITSFRVDDLSGGFLASPHIQPWDRDKNKYYFNQGLETHRPGRLTLPPKNTTDAALQTVDASGYRAANKRVHSAMFEGDWVGFIDTQMIRSASTTDPALELPGTDNVTEKVTAVAVGDVAGTPSLVIAGAATDNIQYTQDAAASTVSWTELVSLSDTPYINWIKYFPQWQTWIFSGRPSTAAGKGIYHFAQDASLPVSSFSKVVDRLTKDQLSTNTTNLSSVDLAITGVDNGSASADSGFMTASGGGATCTPAAGVTTSTIYYGNGNFSAATNFAKGRRVTGIQVVVTHEVNNADANIYVVACKVRAGGSSSISFSDGSEVGTSGSDTFGGSSVTGGLNITTDDLAELAVEISYVALSSGAGTRTITISDVDVTITYATDGDTVTPTLGGFGWQVPSEPDVVYEIAPESDDLTGNTVRRILKKYTFTWDATTDRPVVDVEYPAINLNTCGLGCDYTGGIAVAGGSTNSVFDTLKLIDSQGRVLDVDFRKSHGTNALTITQMFSQGEVLIVDTAYTDGSEAQRWMLYRNRWHASWVQQDKASAISTEPILWAETTHNLQLNYAYRFFPVSTTALAGAREFVAPDLFSDPFLTNTSVVRQDGPLYVQLVELDVGPEEANKTILTMQCQSRFIDDDTAYGSVQVQIDTGGDRTVTAAEVDITWDASSELFTDRTIVSSGDPGVAFRTQIWRITLDHATGTARTPNGLPLLQTTSQQFPHLEVVTFVLDSAEQNGDLLALKDRFIALANVKNVQKLLGGGLKMPAMYVDMPLQYEATVGVEAPLPPQIKGAAIAFRRTTGSVE